MDIPPTPGPAKVDPAYSVPKGVECPRCKQVIEMAQGVTPGAGRQFKKGMILVCGSCSLICKVGDSALIPMSILEIKQLAPETQRQLMVTVKTIAARAAQQN